MKFISKYFFSSPYWLLQVLHPAIRFQTCLTMIMVKHRYPQVLFLPLHLHQAIQLSDVITFTWYDPAYAVNDAATVKYVVQIDKAANSFATAVSVPLQVRLALHLQQKTSIIYS